MFRAKNMIFFIFFHLFCLEPRLFSSQSYITPRRQILTQSKILNHQRAMQPHVFVSAYDRDEIVSQPQESDMQLSGGVSLFNHPITKETDFLLQKSCTAHTTQQALEVITPKWKDKTDQELISQKLSMVEQFALHNLLEALLKRCDSIINKPEYNLAESKKFSNSEKTSIALKNFQDFPHRSTEQLFLKFYKHLAKMQNHECLFPRNFNPNDYLNTTKFDVFFESNNVHHNDHDFVEIQNPVTPRLYTTLLHLAILGDKLEQNLAQKANNQMGLKRPRVES